MVESTAASVVLMVCTQANPGPQSLHQSIDDSREKVYQQRQDWRGKVMLDCVQPLGQVSDSSHNHSPVPTGINLISPNSWRCVYQCPSNTHGKMVFRKCALRRTLVRGHGSCYGQSPEGRR